MAKASSRLRWVNASILRAYLISATPENSERLLGQFAQEAAELHQAGIKFIFGGTPAVAEYVSKLSFFEKIFEGSKSPEQVLAYLKGQPAQNLTYAGYLLHPSQFIEKDCIISIVEKKKKCKSIVFLIDLGLYSS